MLSVGFIFILALTLLFVYDYFSDIFLAGLIPKGVLIAIMIGLILFSMVFKKYRKTSNEVNLRWGVISTLYILLLMGILTILGGSSSVGISFENPFLWVVLMISIFDTFRDWKKVKSEEAQ